MLFTITLHNQKSTIYSKTENIAVIITSPFEAAIKYCADFIKGSFDAISSLMHARDENIELKHAILKLRDSYITSKILKQENEDLKKKLHYIEDGQVHYKTARLVAGIYNNSLKEAFINAGKRDSIAENSLVFNENGALGRIISVENNSSKVMLLNDLRSYIPVKSITTGNRMLLGGNGDNQLIIKFISENREIEIGEILLTSSEAHLIPDNIPVGKVVGFDGEHYLVKPFNDLSNIDTVFIYSAKQ